MNIAPIFSHPPLAAFSLLGESKSLVWLYASFVVVMILVMILVFVRSFVKRKGSGSDIALDTDFLDHAAKSNLLTPEEMRKVREAMVRRALREQEEKVPATSLQDLSMLLAQGKEGVMQTLAQGQGGAEQEPKRPEPQTEIVEPKPEPEPPAISEPEPSHEPEKEKKPVSEEPPPLYDPVAEWEQQEAYIEQQPYEAVAFTAPKVSGAEQEKETAPAETTVDLEMLYKQHLISRFDYERLRGLGKKARKKDQ